MFLATTAETCWQIPIPRNIRAESGHTWEGSLNSYSIRCPGHVKPTGFVVVQWPARLSWTPYDSEHHQDHGTTGSVSLHRVYRS